MRNDWIMKEEYNKVFFNYKHKSLHNGQIVKVFTIDIYKTQKVWNFIVNFNGNIHIDKFKTKKQALDEANRLIQFKE